MQNWNENSLEELLTDYLMEVHGYRRGHSAGFDREYGFDRTMLLSFLEATQPDELESWKNEGGLRWQEKLLHQLFSTIGKRGIAAVWRNGFKCGACRFTLYYPRPAGLGTAEQQARWGSNIFSVTRQLHYSAVAARDSIDVALFVNGLPLATLELKNSFTGQSVAQAMRQYREDRNPQEPLFGFGRCAVHFALDSDEAWMTTHLQGSKTYFLPFNKGTENGGGNPPREGGLKTAYLWEEVFAPHSVGELIEEFLQMAEEESKKGVVKKRTLLFPRYHQREAVQQLLSDAASHGPGRRYLVQHSAGSGKSYTIAWLCFGLTQLSDEAGRAQFSSVILVTDRRVLDRQISRTLKSFSHIPNLIKHADKGSWQLREALQSGTRIVITTIQKFPHILEEIGALPQASFAIVIDEAHSSQSGRAASGMSIALAGGKELVDGDYEDRVIDIIGKRKMLKNASYFAFTATPKNRTLEAFGEDQGETASPRFVPFHEYTMKQAIAENFILDVLENYTTYQTFYTVVKTIDADPEFGTSRAQKKLRAMVEKHPDAIRKKAEIMIEHFRAETAHLIGGKAKAMIVTSGIENAIRYRLAFDRILAHENLPYRALVAFTGEKTVDGLEYSEEAMNGFEGGKIPEEFKKPEYRFLIVAEKFQTGFDEPLLHTMYVDKPLAGVQAVQTLSRLNRSHPDKAGTFVLDFANKAEAIRDAFEPFYKGTQLTEETDLNRLNQLQDDLEEAGVFSEQERTMWVRRYLDGEPREQLESVLDTVFVPRYKELSPDEQVKWKGDYKSFNRAYEFLSAIRPFKRIDWEELAILGRFLVPKLPAPAEDDLSKGVLEATALQSYRVVRRDVQSKIDLMGEGEIEPAQIPGGGLKPEEQTDALSAIVQAFNDRFGKPLTPSQEQFLGEELPQKLRENAAYQAAKIHSDRQNARDLFMQNFRKELQARMLSETDLYKKISDDKGLEEFLISALFDADYENTTSQQRL